MKNRPIVLTPSLLARFWAKIEKTETCWLWTGATDDCGYGYIGAGGKYGSALIASRVAYTIAHGPIPDGLDVCHTCDNPPCVRDDHFFLGTQLDNLRDMDAKGRRRAKPRVDACIHGHAYTPENTKWEKPRIPGGAWEKVCRECARRRSRDFRRELRRTRGDEVRAYKRECARRKREREKSHLPLVLKA